MQALSTGPLDLARLLAEFRVSHPLLEVCLRHAPGGSAELAEELRDGRVDLAILSLPERHRAGISLTPLTSEAMILVCPVGHRLAARKSIRLPELRDEQFIDHPRGWGTRTSIDRSFSAAGVQRQVAFEVGDTASVVNLVRHGLGVAFLPPSIVADSERVALVPVRGRSPLWEISLATPTNRPVSAAARAFADAAVP